MNSNTNKINSLKDTNYQKLTKDGIEYLNNKKQGERKRQREGEKKREKEREKKTVSHNL